MEVSCILDPEDEPAITTCAQDSTLIIKDSLVSSVDRFIQEKSEGKSNLSGRVVVDMCEKYDVDICFVLAQAQYESHFGSRGAAAKTNHVFNLYAYDQYTTDQLIKRGSCVSHPDDSVEPYLRLLVDNYLPEDHDVSSLLKNYVNKNGQRYASSTEYEARLSSIYRRIRRTTDIGNLYDQYIQAKINS